MLVSSFVSIFICKYLHLVVSPSVSIFSCAIYLARRMLADAPAIHAFVDALGSTPCILLRRNAAAMHRRSLTTPRDFTMRDERFTTRVYSSHYDVGCMSASLIRNCLLLGPHSRPLPRALRKSWGGGSFLWARVQGRGHGSDYDAVS